MHLSGRIELTSGHFTSAGPKPRNEDCLAVRIPDDSLLPTKGIVACIADGVSAASAGKEAAEASVLGFVADYFETPESWEAKTAGQRVLTALNRWLFSQGQGSSSAEKGWVTTFTAVIFKSRIAHVFHIGDSRLYRLRGQDFEQITRDHATRISPETCHLTRALGLNLTPRIDYHALPLEPGDRFLLSTDGIHDFITEHGLEALVSQKTSPQEIADELGHSADHANDNRSCVVIDIKTLPDGNKDDIFRKLSALPFPPDLSPGQIIDDLRVERILTASKSSQLYVVSDLTGGNRTLILKTPSVNFSDDPSYLEQFAMEEWIGLRTENKHLTKAVRRERSPSYLYYLMEPVDGITLGRWSEENQTPPVETVIELIAQLTDGVRALHRKDTLHQDLKPDNMILGKDGVLKIIDYGSCHIGGISEISTPFERRDALGTVDFSAPEYRLSIKQTTRSDLFSIATIAYFLFTGGKHPYGPEWSHARSSKDFFTLHYHPAAELNPMVPSWIDGVLRKALSIRQENRHESMSEFIHNLRHPDPEFLATTPIPLSKRNPLLFWKIVAAIGFAGWILTWVLLR